MPDAAMSDVFKDAFCKGKDPKATVKELKDMVEEKRCAWIEQLYCRLEEELVHTVLSDALSHYDAVDNALQSDTLDAWIAQSDTLHATIRSTELEKIEELLGHAAVDRVEKAVAERVEKELWSNGFPCVQTVVHTRHVVTVNGLTKSLWGDIRSQDASLFDDARSQDPSTSLEGNCAVCFEEGVKLVAFHPCGHTCCGTCVSKLENQCHKCRAVICSHHGIFLD